MFHPLRSEGRLRRLLAIMRSDHQCKWCLQMLRPTRFRWYELVFWIVMVRPYKCPHCYERQYRPF